MDKNTKSSIVKLRALREKLCATDAEWKKAFHVRDYVIENLQKLQVKLDDEKISKEQCSKELQDILKYFQENNNV